MPRTTSTLGITLRDGAPVPTAAPCAGTAYQIQPGDDCHKISNSQQTGTGWLLSDNNLGAWCEDFPVSGSLCIANKCDVVTVPANTTCKAVAKSANTTEVLLKYWNPVLNAGCYNIEKLEGHQLCVSPPGPVYVDPNPDILAPTTAITAVPVPTDLAQGTTTYCGRYYQVQPGEYCNLLVLKYHISLSDFLFLNPALYSNCTNLFAYESYCIEPVGDIATYPGQPGSNPTTGVSSIPFTPLVPIFPTVTGVFPAPTNTQVSDGAELPIAPGTRRDCYRYFNGSRFQDASDLAGMAWTNQCQRAADIFGTKWDDMAFWNSDLADIRTPACFFNPQYRYCRQLLPSTSQPPVETPPNHELPIREGAISTCTEYADVPDDWECTDVLENYELTISQLFEYNPAVKSDCSGLWPGMAYCIRAPGYDEDDSSTSASGTMTATTTSTSSASPGGPTHTGQPANCNKWHVVVSGDTCETVPTKYGITNAQFLSWNPAVSSDCTSNFWIGQAYCVGTTSSTTSVVTTTTSSAPGPPGPTHIGQPSACNRWHVVVSGDTCESVPVMYSITRAQFQTWNPAVSADCTQNFWLGQAYCVGVSGQQPAASTTLRINNNELKTFASAFSTPQSRRRTLLKHLRYTVILPTYTDQECGVHENDENRAVNNHVVAEALLALFNVLSSWGSNPAVGFSLLLIIHSPMDVSYRYPPDKLGHDRFLHALGRRQDVFEKRYEYSYIRLSDKDLNLLPTVSCITELLCPSGNGGRQIYPSSLAILTLTKTPNLQRLTWSYNEPGVYVPLRREIRKQFVQDLQTLRIGPFVRSFNFEVVSHFYLHHQRLPNLVFPHEHDPLSSALHHLINSANNLETVTYKGPVDNSLFWPFSAGEEPTGPIWPSVKHVSVHFDHRAPNGQWYVQARPPSAGSVSDEDDEPIDPNAGNDPLPPDAGNYLPPGYGTPEEPLAAVAYAKSLERILDPADGTFNSEKEDFRTWPNEETLRPLLEAFVRGLEHMPSVLTADLTTEPASGGEWFICYYAPGRRSGYEDDIEDQEVSIDSPRVFCHMGDWRPSEDVMDLFRELGRKKHGEECVICFVPWMY
ncbi:carbohydrate-binding module family 50 protein [Cercophora samala]|uniref:Carbohydrate-binding module family 50 protein n=1 Tax=Cercophora samala TaxID=330535 RepID=A0AA39ZFF8_9PEZI|nr:carbohydrate-binding module family 50 protein [Cercophora samala]